MKMYSIIGVIVFSILIGPTGAMAFTINDSMNGANSYWGAGHSSDVVGGQPWDVDHMDVTVSGNIMTVTLVSLSGGFQYYASMGGDLYLSSTGWHVNNSDPIHYSTDTFTQSEGWNYVVTPGGVYNLNNFGNITLTSIGSQAYKGGYDPSNPSSFVTSASVGISSDSTSMTFQFNDFFLANPLNVGLHWTMYCGNDVVEGGGTPVPEPGSLLFLGLGIAGLGVYRRRAWLENRV